VEIKTNGSDVLAGTITMQRAGADYYAAGTLTAGGKQVKVEQSRINGSNIIRNGDTYQSFQSRHNGRGMETLTPNTQKLMGMVADTLVGDVKTQFVSGGNTISVHLDSAQVPDLANVAVAAALEMQAKWQGNGETRFGLSLQNIVPIMKNAKIKSVDVVATVKNNLLTTQNVTVVMTGLDANGRSTEMQMMFHYDLSKIGSTVPKTIDTTGKTVKQMPSDR